MSYLKLEDNSNKVRSLLELEDYIDLTKFQKTPKIQYQNFEKFLNNNLKVRSYKAALKEIQSFNCQKKDLYRGSPVDVNLFTVNPFLFSQSLNLFNLNIDKDIISNNSYSIYRDNKLIVSAISKGHSSAKYSFLGSKYMTKNATEILSVMLRKEKFKIFSADFLSTFYYRFYQSIFAVAKEYSLSLGYIASNIFANSILISIITKNEVFVFGMGGGLIKSFNQFNSKEILNNRYKETDLNLYFSKVLSYDWEGDDGQLFKETNEKIDFLLNNNLFVSKALLKELKIAKENFKKQFSFQIYDYFPTHCLLKNDLIIASDSLCLTNCFNERSEKYQQNKKYQKFPLSELLNKDIRLEKLAVLLSFWNLVSSSLEEDEDNFIFLKELIFKLNYKKFSLEVVKDLKLVASRYEHIKTLPNLLDILISVDLKDLKSFEAGLVSRIKLQFRRTLEKKLKFYLPDLRLKANKWLLNINSDFSFIQIKK